VARGWESKAVEAQIEEGKQAVYTDAAHPHLSIETKARLQKLESLRLSRSRVLQQLERAKHASHREILLRGLQAIEKEIEQVSAESNPSR
jgi:seryl-tRNA synthetase